MMRVEDAAAAGVIAGRAQGDSQTANRAGLDGEQREQAGKGAHSKSADASEVDVVNHPSHYTWLNGLEAIDVTEQFNFNLGNALKYILRSGRKGEYTQDLEKAKWYLDREIARLG